jgi:hypothetical protein
MEGAPSGAPLTHGAARLVAAALRLVVSLVYRGAGGAIGVALHLLEEAPTHQTHLEPTDGFYLFDLHAGGNGAARAIERDGIELLLRMTHRLLVHLEDPARLLAFHDEWDGLLSEAARRMAREQALTWLSSRLTFEEVDEEETL